MSEYQLGQRLPVHLHGYVSLLEVMGSDEAIVDAARISYDRRGKTEDRTLIRYLLRHRHTSPFEMGVMRWELKMPIFVARQWVRHRTASLNELSARYTELPDEMFIPEVVAMQSKDNKQGRVDGIDEELNSEMRAWAANAMYTAYDTYEKMLAKGVSREIARGVLPLNIYTKFVWKMDLHNLMHFLDLRLDPHAQQEIRDYAEVIEKMVALYFPVSYEAFVDYVRDAYTCSRMEVKLLRQLLHAYMYEVPILPEQQANSRILEIDAEAGVSMSKRELAEFRKRFLDG